MVPQIAQVWNRAKCFRTRLQPMVHDVIYLYVTYMCIYIYINISVYSLPSGKLTIALTIGHSQPNMRANNFAAGNYQHFLEDNDIAGI